MLPDAGLGTCEKRQMCNGNLLTLTAPTLRWLRFSCDASLKLKLALQTTNTCNTDHCQSCHSYNSGNSRDVIVHETAEIAVIRSSDMYK